MCSSSKTLKSFKSISKRPCYLYFWLILCSFNISTNVTASTLSCRPCIDYAISSLKQLIVENVFKGNQKHSWIFSILISENTKKNLSSISKLPVFRPHIMDLLRNSIKITDNFVISMFYQERI